MKLELKNICKSFGEKQVLKDMSFVAESGKALGMLGRNGAGKTTSLRIIMNVFHADSGEVLVDGSPINYETVKFGYLPEERGLYPKKKIMEQLVYFAELKGMRRADAVSSIESWLERFEMTEYKNKRLDTLSKGNQQKIQLITAIVHDPHIVILDEPFSGLDPVNAMILKDVVKEIIANGKIVIFSSHQMNYIEEFCDTVAILHEGNINLYGEIKQIKRSYPRNRLVVQSEQNELILSKLRDKCRLGEDNKLIVSYQGDEEKNNVIRELIDHFDMDEIKVYEPTLNDIFVEHTSTYRQGDVK